MKISDIAHLARISTRMLRHYDEIGLFKPNRVDPATSYREYSVSQIPHLNRILALRDLGFSLEQIGRLVADEFSPERLRDLLELRKSELETHIREARERLARVEDRLAHIDQEQIMNTYLVTVKPLPAQLVASVRDQRLEVVSEGERDIGRYYVTLGEHLRQHGVGFAPPQITLWHRDEQYGLDQQVAWDAEVTQGLERPIPASDRVRVYELPGEAAAACLEYRGRYDWRLIEPLLLELFAWVERNGYQAGGSVRYVTLSSPEAGEEHCVLELQIPVVKA